MKIAWWLWSRVLGMMSTGMYAHELGTPEITLESAWRDEGGVRIRTHVELVLAIIEWLRPAGEDASSR
jgi:hypothetical protein